MLSVPLTGALGIVDDRIRSHAPGGPSLAVAEQSAAIRASIWIAAQQIRGE